MLAEKVCVAVEAVIRERGPLPPVELLESMADVLFVPLPRGKARGASFVFAPPADRPVAVLDAGLFGPALHGIAAHEAGHLVLHPWANRVFMQASALALPGRWETEADVFALAYLLRWDPGFAERFGWDVERLARACGLPRAAPYAGQVAARVLGRAMHEGLWAP